MHKILSTTTNIKAMSYDHCITAKELLKWYIIPSQDGLKTGWRGLRFTRVAVNRGLTRVVVWRGLERFWRAGLYGLRIEDLGPVTGSSSTTVRAGLCRFRTGTWKCGLNDGSVRFGPSQTARMAGSTYHPLSKTASVLNSLPVFSL